MNAFSDRVGACSYKNDLKFLDEQTTNIRRTNRSYQMNLLPILEELCLLAQNLAEKHVGKTAGAHSEPFIC